MAQGIWISGRRPKSKKEIKEVIAENKYRVSIEATSLYRNEFSGLAVELPLGQKVFFVGPDPYTKRNFYGTIEMTEKGLKVS